ncbi:MAG: alpha/beta hydrolase [Casimicrobiaceae bacterium]
MTLGDLPSPGAAALHHTLRFADACGHRLEYVDIPARRMHRPPLVLLHEGLGSVAMWRDFPGRVAAATGCRSIVYSRYGFGRSSPRVEPCTPLFMHEEALRILPALRAELGIARPVLIGHSTGASMALIHAGAEGADVAGLVIMAPLVFVEEFNLDSIRAAREVYRTTDMRQKLARYHDDVDGVFWGWNDIWLHPAFRSWSIADDLRGIRCPILAILGDDDEYSTPAQIDAIRRNRRARRPPCPIGRRLFSLPCAPGEPRRDLPPVRDRVSGAVPVSRACRDSAGRGRLRLRPATSRRDRNRPCSRARSRAGMPPR